MLTRFELHPRFDILFAVLMGLTEIVPSRVAFYDFLKRWKCIDRDDSVYVPQKLNVSRVRPFETSYLP